MGTSLGNALVSFRTLRSKKYRVSIRSYNADLLGFNVCGSVLLPSRIKDPKNPRAFIDEDVSVGDKPANFKPFDYFHVHCDIIDTQFNLYNGKKSSLLVRIPVKECDFGEMLIYYLTGLRGRKCISRFNKIRIWITDEGNNLIDFNGSDIQYELLFEK